MKQILTLLLVALCLGSARADYETFDEALRAGAEDASAQNYADARAALGEASVLAKTDSQRTDVWFLLAQIDTIEKKYADARAGYSRVLNSKTVSASLRTMAQLGIGQSYFAEGKLVQARAEYAGVADSQSTEPIFRMLAHLKVGTIYLAEKNYADARKEFVKLLSLKNSVATAEMNAVFFIAKSYLEEKNYAEARTQFGKVLDLALPANPDVSRQIRARKELAQLNVAWSYVLEKNYAQANKEFGNVLLMENVDPANKVKAEEKIKLLNELPQSLNKLEEF